MFSIVIPLFNKEQYITKTVTSILNQEFEEFEIIVVNDGSTDNSLEVLDLINDHRLIVITQDNAGEGAARNTGIRAANNSFIAFLDADDYWDPKHLLILKRLIHKFPSCGLYASNFLISSNSETRKPDINGISQGTDQEINNYFEVVQKGDQFVNSSNCCIPLKIFNDVGYFKVNEPLGTDLDMWGRVALKYNIAFSLEIGAYYNQGATNRVCDTYISKQELPFGRYIRENPHELKSYGNSTQVYSYINSQLIERASANIKMGERRYARNLIKKYNGEKLMQKYFWLFMSFLPSNVLKYIRYYYQKL